MQTMTESDTYAAAFRAHRDATEHTCHVCGKTHQGTAVRMDFAMGTLQSICPACYADEIAN